LHLRVWDPLHCLLDFRSFLVRRFELYLPSLPLTLSTESPRYLAWIGQNAEAWAVIQRIHNDPSDPSNSFAHAEFTQIVRQVEHDKEQKAGYIQMFVKPSWRRRSLLVMFLTYLRQTCQSSCELG
jgi:hypothetical protein